MEMKVTCPQSGCCDGITNNAMKRRRTDTDPDIDFRGNSNSFQHFRGRKFIPLRGGSTIFQSEDIKGEETLFLPFREDILLNMDSVDQISFSSGTYFIGSDAGTYLKSASGEPMTSSVLVT
ncbi:uncharacterized protein [Ptychodera flava]|uniref:uncharacterized protein isoform X2 n=1 Tax=Ptychodera flava TaxID=63121 RepID=UPI003969EFDA